MDTSNGRMRELVPGDLLNESEVPVDLAHATPLGKQLTRERAKARARRALFGHGLTRRRYRTLRKKGVLR